jgi:hypothetical protein
MCSSEYIDRMSPHQAISLDFKPVQKLTTEAGFTYSIVPECRIAPMEATSVDLWVSRRPSLQR